MSDVNEFSGNWTYRSFINAPGIDTPADDVLLATGDLNLEVKDSDNLSAETDSYGTSPDLDAGGSEVSGLISFGNRQLTISGTAKPGDPSTIRFTGTGVEGTYTAGWIYDYLGYLLPSWPKGEGQLPAIVGTVIRTVPHAGDGGTVRPAGFTLSFIAVSRDQPDNS